MKRDNAELQALFSKLFPFLDKEDIGAFFSLSQHKTFKNKEAIFKAGTTSRKAAFIVSGVTRAYFINKEGVEKNAMLRVEGTFMGVPEWLFDNSPTKYTCEAILECELLIFNLVDLENLAKKKPALFELYIWALKEMMITMIYRIESMINLSPEERYKDLLSKYPFLFEKTFNKHIANFLGITPVSLSRIIKRLKDNAKS